MAAGGALAVVVLAAVPAFVSEGPAAVIHAAFSSLCHQQTDRAFALQGSPFAVCHRCFGLYTGVLLGVAGVLGFARVEHVFHRFAAAALLMALAVLGLNWGLDVVGLWSNSTWTRFGTGLFLGLVGGVFLRRALVFNQPAIRPSPNYELQ